MNCRLAAALIMAAAAATLPAAALAQFPPPPPPGSQGVFPPPPPPGSQGAFPAPPAPGQSGVVGGGGFGPPPQQGAPGGLGPQPQAGGMPAVCANFIKLKEDADVKGRAIQEANKKHDRKLACGAFTRFVEVEGKVVKFLVDNKTACRVPDEAIANAKAGHEKVIQIRDQVCAEQPQPKAPSLSDALGTPMLDTRKNTKTGKGTLDTLTGNPLEK